ncbi:MAG: ribosomal subunit interface protein [Sphingomonas sp.]|nr:ribosomal subunit interface protein [Sphingomonas sp.]|tara:strand:+ start:2807 stop:3166 length:360 start_codon:yes stop_codon:yes gene_type:complete
MSINITGVHFSVTDALRDNVEARIKRLSKRYHLINANVSFSQSHDDFTCKVEYKGDNQDAQAQATDKDLYKAISVVFDRIERQLNDQKELAKGKGRKSIRDMDDESSLDEPEPVLDIES